MEFNPDTVQLLTEEEINAHSKAQWQKFYQNVEQLLKRHHPIEWSQMVANNFRDCRTDFERFAWRPPQHMLHSIEANAAYWRRQNHDPVTLERFKRVMGLYVRHDDPLQLSFAAKDVTHFAIVLDREQMEIQVHPSHQELARQELLFVHNDPIPRLSAALLQRYGVTPWQWLHLCERTFLLAFRDPESRVVGGVIAEFARKSLGLESIAGFIEQSVCTPDQLARNYRSIRSATPTHFHAFINSAFVEMPIIEFGGGRWLVPHPALVTQHMGRGMHRMFTELWQDTDDPSSAVLREEFANTVENHVCRILECCANKVALIAANRLRKMTPGKSCDFLLETRNAILLVESKGVLFTRRLLVPKWMQEDPSTDRIIGGCLQLRQTYEDLRCGGLNSLVTDRTKPVVSLIATYGKIPYANTDWYWNKVIAPRAELKGTPLAMPSCGLPSRPIVMNHETLEFFIIALNMLGMSPQQLLEEYAHHPSYLIGEWNNFLKLQLHGKEIDGLPCIDEAAARFYNSVSE